MAEFFGMEDNWGLQAIVRGSASAFCNTAGGGAISNGSDSCYGVLDLPKDDDDLLFNFPHLLETAAMLTDELEALYKPFYPVSPAENTLVSSFSVPDEIKEEAMEVQVEPKQICLDQSADNSTAVAYMPKYKRRKNQQKRVVLQVTAEDLSSDMWAWRKYGQKPIKGSPYPRSYYRCSSSKGCLARKQVEQSCTDPSIFIITYTAEHSHSQPTRKNALAGTIRHKFPNTKSLARSSVKATKSKDSSASSPTSSADVLSPRTPLITSTQNDFPKRKIRYNEICAEQMVDGSDEKVIISDIKLEDDFFSGLEDIWMD